MMLSFHKFVAGYSRLWYYLFFTYRYLLKTKGYRDQGIPLYFLDETWVNSGHAKQQEWVDRTGLGRESKVAPVKGSRLIITDIGCETGFLEGGLLTFRSKSTSDYHEEMDDER